MLGAMTCWRAVTRVWAAVWGRIAPLLAIQAFPYLREQGTAGFHRRHWQGLGAELRPALLLLVLLTGLALALGQGPWWWLGWLGVIPAWLVPWSLGQIGRAHV